MWLSFALCVALAIIVLFLPGFLVLKSVRFSSISSLAAAPAVTVPGYAIFCIVLSFLHIPASGLLVFGALFLFGIICFLFSLIISKNNIKLHNNRLAFNKKDWLILFLYFVISTIIGIFFFVRSLDTPMSFFQDYDNIYHLNLVQSFLDSGDWSCLHASVYTLAEFNSGQTPLLSWGGYYPAAWHCLNALITSLTEAHIVIAQNALLYVFSFISFPFAVFLFLKTLFNNNHKLLAYGAILCLTFEAFPWGLLMWGPIYPNLAAFCLVPISGSLFYTIFKRGLPAKRKLIYAMLFLLSLAGYILIQPNAIFTIALLFIPFVVLQSYLIARSLLPRTKKITPFIFPIITLIVIIAIWLWFYTAPFMQSTVSFNWPSTNDTSESLLNAISLAVNFIAIPQWLVAALVIIGMIYSLSCKKYLWLTISYIIILIFFVIGTSTEGYLKHIAIGFWYTDPNRIAAMIVLPGIPLACLGLSLLLPIIEQLINKALHAQNQNLLSSRLINALACIIFMACIFFPYQSANTNTSKEATAFGGIQNKLISINNQSAPDLFDEAERNFIIKAKSITGESLILNSPGDGSVFAYALYDLNIYYRSVSNYQDTAYYTGKGETESSYLARTSLKDKATNVEVENAINDLDAEYVLILDSEKRETRTYNALSYDPNDWKGIDSITEETPGFTLLLEEDGMKLFEINK